MRESNSREQPLGGFNALIGHNISAMPLHACDRVTVLLVSPVEEDWNCLDRMFLHTNWILYRARDYKEATRMLENSPISVLITEAQLPGGRTWRDLLEFSSAVGRPRVIVTAPLQDDPLWAQVLSLGGYDVLMKPLDHAEVVRVVSLAWLNWKEETGQRQAPPPSVA